MKNFNPRIAIFGLGYVGLPLSIEFSKCYDTVGFDVDEKRIKDLKSGFDHTNEITSFELKKSKIKFTNNKDDIKNCNVYIVTVPTPVDEFKKPNLSYLELSCKTIGLYLKKNDIVIFESTVYPGVTEDFCVPILEKFSNLKFNNDFFCGYSPERINPGDKLHTIDKIVKVTSGSTEESSIFVDNLYKKIVKAGTYKASSIKVAEAAKVIENIQRDVNIALINELSMIFNKLDIDTKEVLNSASTKWNFLPFMPGLVGGHCIGVDPYYLTHKALEINFHPEMILAGRRVNDGMGKYIADRSILMMLNNGISPNKAKIGVFGLTFKEDCPDIRNTKVIDIVDTLYKYGCKVLVSDEHADAKEVKKKLNIDLTSFDKMTSLDCVIIAVEHSNYKNISSDKWVKKLNDSGVIIDVKSIFKINSFKNTNINHWRL